MAIDWVFDEKTTCSRKNMITRDETNTYQSLKIHITPSRMHNGHFLQICLLQQPTVNANLITRLILIDRNPMSHASALSASVELELLVAPEIEFGCVCLADDRDLLDLVVCPLYAVAAADGAVAFVEVGGEVGQVQRDGFAVAGCAD
jgi:hypothetical protein